MRVVTFTTDFGTNDSYVASMKGIILSLVPYIQLIDITNNIEHQNVFHGSFVLSQSWKDFPKSTIHLGVVDPGVGGSRNRLIVETQGHYFVGPDNGLFGFTTPFGDSKFWRIKDEIISSKVSLTFEGRDIFAPIVGRLLQGVLPNELGSPLEAIQTLEIPQPKMEKQKAIGEIIHVDHFGNLITNFVPNRVPQKATIWVGNQKIGPMVGTYSDVPKDKPVVLWNSSNRLEIGVRNGSARKKLKAKVGTKVVIKW